MLNYGTKLTHREDATGCFTVCRGRAESRFLGEARSQEKGSGRTPQITQVQCLFQSRESDAITRALRRGGERVQKCYLRGVVSTGMEIPEVGRRVSR